METICLQCGDKGCENAFVYCIECLDFAVHRYCLHVIPKTLDEYVYWVCDDCEEKLQDESLIIKDDFIPCETRCSEGSLVETNKTNVVVVSTEEQVYEGALQHSYDACPKSPSESHAEPHMAEPHVVSYNESHSQRNSKKRKTVTEANFEDQRQGTSSTRPLNENEAIDSENRCLDMSTEGGGIGSSNDHNENRELIVSESSAKPLQMIKFWNYSMNESNTSSTLDSRPCPEPIIRPIWRGSFNIQNQKNDILNGLMAHISNKACQKVYEEACQFQPMLHLEMLPKSDVWPKSFEISEPTSDNIALYFFPSEISKWDFDLLLDEMVREELAMRTFVQNAELLVFPSDLLPLQYWKFQGKYYLWGVFRGKPAPSHSHSCTEDLGDKPLMHEDPNGDIIEVKLKNFDSPSPQSQNKFVVLKDDAIPCETRDSKGSEVETNKTNMVLLRMEEHVYERAPQQPDDACPQPPCESGSEPCAAEPRVVLDNESERSSKRMKTVGSDEAMFEKQIQETGSTGPRNESEAIVLGNKVEVIRTDDQVYLGALQQSDNACPQPPCESEAEPRVVLNNESERGSERMKTVGSYEATFVEQIKETGSTRPQNENEDIVLENRNPDTSLEGRGVGPSNDDHNENTELVVRTERVITPPWNNFPSYLNTVSYSYPYSEPNFRPVWRGSVNVWNQNNHIVYGVTAHISNATCQRVYEEASQFQPPLHQFQPPPLHQFQPPPLHLFQPPPLHLFQPPPLHQFQPPPLHQFQPQPLHTEMHPKSDVQPNVVEPKLSSAKTRMRRLRRKMKKKSEKAGFESEPKKAKEELKGKNKKNNFKENKSNGKCFYCGVDGHWKRNCTKFLSER